MIGDCEQSMSVNLYLIFESSRDVISVMLVSQKTLVRVELFSHLKTFF